MILRRITQHVKEQNWFAVGLDFAIVVIGVGMALAAGEWLNTRAQKADLAVARSAINEEMSIIYANALERVAVKECRIAQVQSIAEKLGNNDETWTGITGKSDLSSISGALPSLMRSPFRSWPSGALEAAKVRGLLNLMEPMQRQYLESAFFIAPTAIELQNTIFNKQSQLKALSLEFDITPSDRLRYYDVLAEIDAASALLELGSEFTIINMQTSFVDIAPATLDAFYANLRDNNAAGLAAYGDCYEPTTLPNVDLTPVSAETTP